MTNISPAFTLAIRGLYTPRLSPPLANVTIATLMAGYRLFFSSLKFLICLKLFSWLFVISTKFLMPISRGKNPKRLIKSDGRIKFTKEAIILTNISVQNPRYWPTTTALFEKFLLLKKATRRNRSSKLVAMKADADMVNSIKLSMRLFLCFVMILNFFKIYYHCHLTTEDIMKGRLS